MERNKCARLFFSLLLARSQGQAVVTVEGLGTRQYNSPRHSVNGNACKENGKDGNKTRTRKLHPIQAAMVRTHASQCGFCTPGFVMSAYVAYRQLQECDRDAIDWEEAISGNLCRCTGYRPILAALESLTSDRAMVWEKIYIVFRTSGARSLLKVCWL